MSHVAIGSRALEMMLRASKGWPASVKGWKVEQGLDSTGHDAFWVWVTLENPLSSRSIRAQVRARVRDEVLQYVEPDPSWVYVRFRGESEPEPNEPST